MSRITAISVLVALPIACGPAAAFDEVKGWTAYCMAEFQNQPAAMNAALVFGVTPTIACDCIALPMAKQTTPEDHKLMITAGRMPPRLKALFGEMMQACLILYGRN